MKYLKLSLYFILVFWCTVTKADPLDHWHWLSPQPQGDELNRVAYINTHFVAVGNLGAVVYSVDGINWSAARPLSTNDLYSLTYGNGLYVTGGAQGTIFTSPDLTTWTQATSPATSSVQGIAYGNGFYLAVTYDGDILKSEDGADWTASTPAMSHKFRALYFLNGTFWLAGQQTSGAGILLKSTDGVAWTEEDLGGTGIYSDITENNGELLVTEAGRTLHIRSTEGTWQSHNGLRTGTDSIFFGAGYYFANTTQAYPSISADGDNWTLVDHPKISAINYGTFAEGLFVLVGRAGVILRSSDGTNFTESSTGSLTDGAYFNFAFGAGRIVAAGYVRTYTYPDTTKPALVSISAADNSQQTYSFDTQSGISTVLWSGENFFAAGDFQQVLSSSDGLAWTTTTISSLPRVASAAWGNNRLVCIPYSNDSDIAVMITDGTSVTLQNTITIPHPMATTYWKGEFWLAAEYGQALYRSADGTSWSRTSNTLPFDINYICSGGDQIAVTSYTGDIAVSKNGTEWTTSSLNSWPLRPSSIRYLKNRFIVLVNDEPQEEQSAVYSSVDGITWKRHDQILASYITDIIAGNGQYYLLGHTEGYAPLMMKSDPNIELSLEKQPTPSLTIDGIAGHYYQIQRSPSVGPDANWQQIDRVFCPTMPFTFEDSTATGSGPYFYRTIMEETVPE